MSNRLSLEHSPYLLQHAQNPVDWRPWEPEVFEDEKVGHAINAALPAASNAV